MRKWFPPFLLCLSFQSPRLCWHHLTLSCTMTASKYFAGVGYGRASGPAPPLGAFWDEKVSPPSRGHHWRPAGRRFVAKSQSWCLKDLAPNLDLSFLNFPLYHRIFFPPRLFILKILKRNSNIWRSVKWIQYPPLGFSCARRATPGLSLVLFLSTHTHSPLFSFPEPFESKFHI